MLSNLVTCLIFLAFSFQMAESIGTPVVNISGLGSVRGSKSQSYWSKRTIYQFLSIPYAEPPVGQNRFKPPIPKAAWGYKVLDTSKFKHICPQFTPIGYQNVVGNEDCLYLSLYVPSKVIKESQNGKLPVMVFIHGGSFRVRSSRDFPPNYLLDKDVILVVPQYRLGVIGFLALDIETAPGNMGFLDMLESLKWVNKYISSFKGDPNKVTIFGQSAGAAAVTIMQFSPLVPKGLFQQIIAQSGSAGSSFVFDDKATINSLKYLKFSNCSYPDIIESVNCLKLLPADKLLKNQDNLEKSLKLTSEWSPSFMNAALQSPGKYGFLTEDPRLSLMRENFTKYPMITGVTRDEGTFIVGELYDILKSLSTSNSDLLNDAMYLQHNIVNNAFYICGLDDSTFMTRDMIEEIYFPNSNFHNFVQIVPELSDILGTCAFKASSFHLGIKNHFYETTYLYSFHYKGNKTKFGYGAPVDYPFSGGVAHSDDTIYLFPYDGQELNDKDDKVAKLMVEMWTNFAIYGDPNGAGSRGSWFPISNEKGPYYIIDTESKLGQNSRLDYYLSIIDKENSTNNGHGSHIPFITFAPSSANTYVMNTIFMIPIAITYNYISI